MANIFNLRVLYCQIFGCAILAYTAGCHWIVGGSGAHKCQWHSRGVKSERHSGVEYYTQFIGSVPFTLLIGWLNNCIRTLVP
ncbi:hypothetical protein V1508DRAFT_424081 [Lipomyces doorenjongii]|uniref:uncharacterized protein n=1 Tax=Lipomyces doorenjongii TaxID=383834 RepID=UPI0034CED0A0